MAFKLTKSQQSIVDERGKNILVSAAAGSGKTAVLVRRITALLEDENDPVDISNFLIVTFTKDAAAEMKERIYKATLDPQIHFADISTIDAFCVKIVRDHFYEAGVAPDFGTATEEELRLLEGEVLEELILDKFEENEPDFIRLVDTYARRERIDNLKDLIMALYTQSQSYPWPEEWIDGLIKFYEISTEDELKNTELYKASIEHVKNQLESVRNRYKSILKDGPHATFESDLAQVEAVLELSDDKLLEGISCIDFARLSSPKDLDKEEKERIKKTRNKLKDEIKAMCSYAITDTGFFISELKVLGEVVRPLFKLTKEYMSALMEKKSRDNVYSFSDIEHFALRILRDEKTKEPTMVAKSLREKYRHVFVDEYQDSNHLQEAILTAVASDNNYFMVGDVKQSIYRFRKARPDMFNDKYLSYKAGLKDSIAIDLSENFRSRKDVTEGTNAVFDLIMHADIGGIEYDKAARLNFAAVGFPDEPGYGPELLFTNKDDELISNQHIDDNELEARLICKRIKEIVGKLLVGREDDRHPATYSDIVILHRAGNKVADKYIEVFKSQGIPAVATGSKGYFSSYEIESLLALISVINNPMDDISLVSVLTNFYNYSPDELARVRAESKTYEISFSKAFFESGCDCAKKIEELRTRVKEMRLSALVTYLATETGFIKQLLALPGGCLRVTNVEKLANLAVSFEKQRAGSLYDFVNYVGELKDYDVDFGNASLASVNAVRIMTIHKSKGLEFPICFVAGMGKMLGKSDTKSDAVISDRFGAAFSVVDTDLNIKRDSVYKSILKRFEKIDNMAELQRLLYVAMTRAEEKLILTATASEGDIGDLLYMDANKEISLGERVAAKHFLSFIYPAFKRAGYEISQVPVREIVDEEVKEIVQSKVNLSRLKELYGLAGVDALSNITETFGFEYPVIACRVLKNKYSVSEVKKMHIERTMEPAEGELFVSETGMEDGEEFTKRIPKFMPGYEENINTAAIRGTAVHRVMECLDFAAYSRNDDGSDVKSQIERMVDKGLLAPGEAELITPKEIETFFESDLGRRMCAAESRGELFKEKTFVMSVKSMELFSDLEFAKVEEDDETLIQGIIDAYFIEDGKIILLDYKTDKVNNENVLISRYKSQLLMYEKAITGGTGMEVSGMYLYSFYLGREIIL